VGFERPERFDALAHLTTSLARLPRAHAAEVLLEAELAIVRRELFPVAGVSSRSRTGSSCTRRRTTSTGSRASWRACRSRSPCGSRARCEALSPLSPGAWRDWPIEVGFIVMFAGGMPACLLTSVPARA
jgi:hypothetical protein